MSYSIVFDVLGEKKWERCAVLLLLFVLRVAGEL